MSRYSLFELSKFEFYFEVEELEELQYRVSFSSSAHFLPASLLTNDIYEVSFSKIGDATISNEEVSEKIKHTISFALTNFVNQNNCPLLFICDSLDGKEQCRLRLFRSWYAKLEEKEKYTFEARELYSEAEDFKYYAGLIISIDHENHDQILDEFDDPEIFNEKA